METTSLYRDAFLRHKDVLEKSLGILLPEIQKGGDIIVELFRRGGKVLVCGNGGSAADSQHFAAEWVCKYKNNRNPLPAIALTTDTSALTAIANDYGFEEVFARQISALGAQGDVLVALSTSGSSPNIKKAVAAAKTKGMKVIAMTGSRGVQFAEEADCGIIIPSEETARIQEIHGLIYHMWCEYVDATFLSMRHGD